MKYYLLIGICLLAFSFPSPSSNDLHKNIRFAFQADVHNFNRIPEVYLRKMLSDAHKMGCDFAAWLGDIMDRDEPNPLHIASNSPIPIIYQHGDHELFNEWGRNGFRQYETINPAGELRNDPLLFFRGAIPRQEALTGLPTAWSFDLKGIHFVVCFNGKDIVWYPWFLRWLEEDLKRAEGKTAVLLSHRPLEDIGETAEAVRGIIKKYPFVHLYCYGHSHSSSPFYKVGNALCVNAEANSPYNGKSYEGNWYVMVEVSEDAIRIYRRIMDENKTALLAEEKITTSLEHQGSWRNINLAFLMSDCSVRSTPFRLRNSKLRVYGVNALQILPQDKPLLRERVKGEFVSSDGFWKNMGIEKILRLNWEGEKASDWVELARWEVPVHFERNPERIGVAGTFGGGTVYTAIMLVKGREGEKVKIQVECFRGNGSLESQHRVEGILGNGINALWALTGHIKLNPRFWRWMGVDGKTEIDDCKEPRRAVKMAVSLLAQPEKGECIEVIPFLYPDEAFFTPLTKGRWKSENVKVRVGEKEFNVGNLAEGKMKEFKLGVLEGEKIALHCGGSKLVLVEIKGETMNLWK